ncbi:MAG: helix-turn-helix domain-containing protein [Carbonactinosporaceae bacterium]
MPDTWHHEEPIGALIRRARVERGKSQEQIAEALRQASGNPTVERGYVARWEAGRRTPTPYWRGHLSAVLDIPADVLDRAVAVARGRQSRTRTPGASYGPQHGQPEPEGLEEIRSALSAYPGLGMAEAPGDLGEIEELTAAVHRRYQEADYETTARMAPRLVIAGDAIVEDCSGRELRRALVVQSQVYVVVAKLLTKVGDGHLAWIAADRAVTAALRVDSRCQTAMAAYQVACAFLKLDRVEQAERVAVTSAENVLDDSPLERVRPGRAPPARLADRQPPTRSDRVC